MGRNVIRQDPDSREQTGLGTVDAHFLILHNDDVNTFTHVIESLMEVCGHDSLQAEQIALITHHRGKCDARKGADEELKRMQNGLINRGLLATIE